MIFPRSTDAPFSSLPAPEMSKFLAGLVARGKNQVPFATRAQRMRLVGRSQKIGKDGPQNRPHSTGPDMASLCWDTRELCISEVSVGFPGRDSNRQPRRLTGLKPVFDQHHSIPFVARQPFPSACDAVRVSISLALVPVVVQLWTLLKRHRWPRRS